MVVWLGGGGLGDGVPRGAGGGLVVDGGGDGGGGLGGGVAGRRWVGSVVVGSVVVVVVVLVVVVVGSVVVGSVAVGSVVVGSVTGWLGGGGTRYHALGGPSVDDVPSERAYDASHADAP